MLKKPISMAITALLLTTTLTACAVTSDRLTPVAVNTQTSFDDLTSAADSATTDSGEISSTIVDKERAERLEKYNTENPVVVFDSTLRNGGDKYDCKVYIYNLLSETDDTYKGDCAIEIVDNGEVIDRTMLLVGYTLGQMGTEFKKSEADGYFYVIELESGSVLLSSREVSGTTQATLYTVSGDRIVQIERYFADPADKPEKGSGLRSFNLSRSYATDGDSIIFDINEEKVNVTIDFDDLTLRCDGEYESIVYCE